MKYQYITWIPAFLVMCIIFTFSSKTSENSDKSSLKIATVVYDLFKTVQGDEVTMEEHVELLSTVNHVVRKVAHGFEYFILSLTLAFHLHFCKFGNKMKFYLPFVISCFYAATDEFHQTFVSGRAGQIKDVLIDTSGAFFGVLFFLFCCYIFQKKEQ